MSNFFSQEQATIDEMMTALINKFSWIFSAILKSEGKHVAPLGHSILILSQSVFALAPKCSMLSRKAANTKFYLDPTRVDSMIYHN
jgi:hypothetical protein